ncbi:MAG: RNA 2',3'-cyclic phosphodiesterase [Actinomycetota bacterium]
MTGALAGRRQEPRLRLFVAFDPPERVRDLIETAIGPWRRALPEVRWSARGDWHVTLKFLGAMPASDVDAVAGAIAAAVTVIAPIPTVVTGLGSFPVRGPARVLWAGLDDRAGRLAGVSLAIDAALLGMADPERRPIHPHITVGRCDPARPLPAGFGKTPLARITFEVDRVGLYRSHLSGRPARYELLASAPLGPI